MKKGIFGVYFLFVALIGFAQERKVLTPDDMEIDVAEVDSSFHTKDMENDVAQDPPPPRSSSASKKSEASATDTHYKAAERIGCICMDGFAEEKAGSGACNRHKGVRFWVYERENGDTLMEATEKHRLHPELLAEEESAVFGRAAEEKKDYGFWFQLRAFLKWAAAFAVFCAVIIATVRYFQKSR